ncbi:Asp/Glu racemase [Roseovarius faecimaris]|uniref:Asp/Glu racemase n=1 Tax=Roseovarius faecimaris TaxID=2494550 RepID=A0A6I6IQL7_9RHOB|nr:aspartate/glutamate racemase family protein [Roseovarius faecimaris]QGX98143.1 Asp/Glu racemase [Roseovarius faecimaris]
MRDYQFETRTKTRLGMVVLSTDETLEDEARQVIEGREVSLFHSRIYSAPSVTPESLKAMEVLIPASVELFPEGLDAIAYGCTSASVMMGPEAVQEQVRSIAAQGKAPVTNPITGVMRALGALGAEKIGLVTPYTSQVAGPMRAFLAQHGIETLKEISFGEEIDPNVARISEASTLEAVLEAGRIDGVQAVFASCTNLRAFGIIEEAEAELGLPVISSNLALVWDLLRIGGVDARGWGPGRLFAL